jgi:predicted nucleotidyltransferase
MHFYESSIITTNDGLHCQVYGNEHPLNCILVKPKYIPTEGVKSDALPYRFISGRRMNRLNLWIDKLELKKYIENFKAYYPEYVYRSSMHKDNRLFFSVPISKIERVYSPKKGLQELMSMPKDSLDDHLKTVHGFVNFLMKSGINMENIGVTYSTLMGHYLSKMSDINIVIYGKASYWNLMEYLKNCSHPLLKWKGDEDWMRFYKGRNRFAIFSKTEFLKNMQRKRSEGYFDGTLFLIFGVENEDETWFKWDAEKYEDLGPVTVKGIITNNFDSIVRPGVYEIKNSTIIKGTLDVPVRKIVFYSRDYCMLAYPNENIEACGLLEKVIPNTGNAYYRVVVGYFDSYIDGRREKEFIRVVE